MRRSRFRFVAIAVCHNAAPDLIEPSCCYRNRDRCCVIACKALRIGPARTIVVAELPLIRQICAFRFDSQFNRFADPGFNIFRILRNLRTNLFNDMRRSRLRFVAIAVCHNTAPNLIVTGCCYCQSNRWGIISSK